MYQQVGTCRAYHFALADIINPPPEPAIITCHHSYKPVMHISFTCLRRRLCVDVDMDYSKLSTATAD